MKRFNKLLFSSLPFWLVGCGGGDGSGCCDIPDGGGGDNAKPFQWVFEENEKVDGSRATRLNVSSSGDTSNAAWIRNAELFTQSHSLGSGVNIDIAKLTDDTTVIEMTDFPYDGDFEHIETKREQPFDLEALPNGEACAAWLAADNQSLTLELRYSCSSSNYLEWDEPIIIDSGVKETANTPPMRDVRLTYLDDDRQVVTWRFRDDGFSASGNNSHELRAAIIENGLVGEIEVIQENVIGIPSIKAFLNYEGYPALLWVSLGGGTDNTDNLYLRTWNGVDDNRDRNVPSKTAYKYSVDANDDGSIISFVEQDLNDNWWITMLEVETLRGFQSMIPVKGEPLSPRLIGDHDRTYLGWIERYEREGSNVSSARSYDVKVARVRHNEVLETTTVREERLGFVDASKAEGILGLKLNKVGSNSVIVSWVERMGSDHESRVRMTQLNGKTPTAVYPFNCGGGDGCSGTSDVQFDIGFFGDEAVLFFSKNGELWKSVGTPYEDCEDNFGFSECD